MLDRTKSFCATCARGGLRFASRHREFLLAPGSLFTLTSLVLLVAASIHDPAGLLSTKNADHSISPLYLAAASVGSVFIWWSAIQGIRRHDFTADIPVSIATAAALAIGQYSAAAVVA